MIRESLSLYSGEPAMGTWENGVEVGGKYSATLKKGQDMMPNRVSACALLLLMLLPARQAMANDIRSVTISGMKDAMSHRIAAEVVRAMYIRAGVKAEFKYYPARRSLELANSGKTDGEMARIAGTEQAYPHLVRISTPVFYINGVVFTKRVTRDIRTWTDLKGLKVGIIQGVRYSEVALSFMKTFRARSQDHLFKLLDHDRIDVAVTVKESGEHDVDMRFKNSGIHIIGQPLYSAPLYHYIHEKNAALAPKLESVLHAMMEEGTIEKLWSQARRKILEAPTRPAP